MWRCAGCKRKPRTRAALEGAERVKEFLASKVRDAEESLAEALRSAESARQQAGADAEVIAFLDERVRCLENEVAEATRLRLELENSLGRSGCRRRPAGRGAGRHARRRGT